MASAALGGVRTLVVMGVVGLTGCDTGGFLQPEAVLAPQIPVNAFETLKNADDAHAELCDHDPADTTFPDQADRITNRFCQDVKPGGVMPRPRSLDEFMALMNLDFKNPMEGNGILGNPAFAILGHSSALTARKVSSITPTVFVFTPLLADGKPPPDYTFVAFDPGEPFLEVASFSPADQAVNFYLVFFDKACTSTAEGCGPMDMLTPNQTMGWSNIRIYESTTALNNTIADCRQCHIGNGRDVPDTGDPLILRMQEIESPHTHWFSETTEGGKALLADFHGAHGKDERYGPIPAALIDKSDPAAMAAFIVAAGFGDQPNPFHSDAIEREVKASQPAQPYVNWPMGQSATWTAMYKDSIHGQFIPAPYHDVKITDADKLTAASDAYNSYLTGGTLDVDIRDVFVNGGLIQMGFAPLPTMTGRELLVQQCQQCHHERLDPTISRDKFLVDHLDEMSREEKDLAIERIQTPVDTRLTMPPPLFRSVDDRERQLMIDALRR